MPGNTVAGSQAPSWRRGPGVRPEFIIDLFTALGRIDATLAAVCVDHILDWPGTFDSDTVIGPAVDTLLRSPETADQAAVRRLRAARIAHLDVRIALPLEAPRDWKREDKLGCKCADCRALSVYLSDATQKTWIFAAAEPGRLHVEATIRAAACDVDVKTEKRGRPYSLICTKNQASYGRRSAQRKSDLAERERLSA